MLFLNLFYETVSNICPKVSEKPKRLFWGSGDAQETFHINLMAIAP